MRLYLHFLSQLLRFNTFPFAQKEAFLKGFANILPRAFGPQPFYKNNQAARRKKIDDFNFVLIGGRYTYVNIRC